MSFKLGTDPGTSVRIDSIYISKTYAGLLIGVPTSGMNDGILHGIGDKARKKIGVGPFCPSDPYGYDPKVTIIQPERKRFDVPETAKSILGGHQEIIPSYYLCALLDGPETDKAYMGAMAMVVLFTDKIDEVPLRELLAKACRDLKWEEIAYNFDY